MQKKEIQRVCNIFLTQNIERERRKEKKRDRVTRKMLSVIICYFSFLDTAQARNVHICARSTLKRYNMFSCKELNDDKTTSFKKKEFFFNKY